MHAIGHKLIYLMYTYSAAVYSVIQTKAGFKPLTYITEDRGLVVWGPDLFLRGGRGKRERGLETLAALPLASIQGRLKYVF